MGSIHPLPVGSASSNISAPLNGSSKEFGFHHQFASSFQSNFNSPSKSKNKRTSGPSIMNEYKGSPPTHKQKQLEEFNINLKQNKIKKYGKPSEKISATPILNKNLRRRLENVTNGNIMNNPIDIHHSERKKIKQKSKLIEGYMPSVFENKNVSHFKP